MKEFISSNKHRGRSFLKTPGMVMLGILMLIGIAGAAPFAYITNLDNTVSVIDTSKDKVIDNISVGKEPFGVAITPDNKKVYITNLGDQTLSAIDTATNKVISTIVPLEVVGHGIVGRGIVASPDGTKIYVAGSGVSVVDTTTNNLNAIINVGFTPLGMAISPDGKKLYATDHAINGTVSIIDTAKNRVVKNVKVGSGAWGIAVSPKGTKVYVTNRQDNTVSVIDTGTNNVTDTIKVGLSPFEVAVTPDSKRVYVTNYDSGTVSVIDTSTNTLNATINIRSLSSPCGVSVTPDGKKVYVANEGSNTVSVIDTSSNKIIATVNVGQLPVAFGQFIGGKPEFSTAAFSACPVSGKAPLTVKFKDESTGAPASWFWKFGDKCISTAKNPVHTYKKAGKYTVSLTVKNASGSDSVAKSRYILVKNR